MQIVVKQVYCLKLLLVAILNRLAVFLVAVLSFAQVAHKVSEVTEELSNLGLTGVAYLNNFESVTS